MRLQGPSFLGEEEVEVPSFLEEEVVEVPSFLVVEEEGPFPWVLLQAVGEEVVDPQYVEMVDQIQAVVAVVDQAHPDEALEDQILGHEEALAILVVVEVGYSQALATCAL